MKTKTVVNIVLLLAIVLGVFSCRKGELKEPTKQVENIVEFKVELPNDLRMGFLQTSADKVYPAFNVGDIIYAYKLSEGKVSKQSEQKIVSVEIDKSGFYVGTFRFALPEKFDKILFTCVPLKVSEDKKHLLLYPSPSFQRLNAEDAVVSRFSQVPAYAVWEKKTAPIATEIIKFTVNGSVMFVELDNQTQGEVTGVLSWSATDKNGGGTYPELQDDFISDSSFKNITFEGDNFEFKSNASVILKPGRNYLATYLRPTETVIPNELQLSWQKEGSTEKKSTEKIIRKKETKWLKNQLILLPPVLYQTDGSLAWYKRPSKPTSPLIRIISSVNRDNFSVRLNAEEADQKDVWVDTNNNGKFDPDELVPAEYFGGSKTKVFDMTQGLSRQKLTFYGKLTKLEIVAQSLTEVHLSGVDPKIKELVLYGNSIKGDKMDKLIESLPNRSTMGNADFGKLVAVRKAVSSLEDNVVTKAQVAKAKAKGWIVYNNNNEVYEGS